MKYRVTPALALVLTLGACASGTGSDTSRNALIEELPEAVRALAAPHQDLTAVRFGPEGRCYWYRHEGPVETTFLPLRTRAGRPICARPAAPPAEEA